MRYLFLFSLLLVGLMGRGQMRAADSIRYNEAWYKLHKAETAKDIATGKQQLLDLGQLIHQDIDSAYFYMENKDLEKARDFLSEAGRYNSMAVGIIGELKKLTLH
jgi:hypothetical protein